MPQHSCLAVMGWVTTQARPEEQAAASAAAEAACGMATQAPLESKRQPWYALQAVGGEQALL